MGLGYPDKITTNNAESMNNANKQYVRRASVGEMLVLKAEK